MNASERRIGLATALTLKAQEDKVRLLETLDAKTSAMTKALKDLKKSTAVVFIAPEESKNTQGIRNIHGIRVVSVTRVNPADLLKYDYCVFTKQALKSLTSHFSE